MENEQPKVGEWLDRLQQESWNLELLVSGFSIFLLMEAYHVLVSGFSYINLNMALEGNAEGMLRALIGILVMGSVVLTINLIAHVFLRGFWIGAIGLRSVQGKIDLDKLGYSDFFTEKLKPRVPSLDRTLEKLDTISSVVFSFTFLIVFMFFSMFLFFSSISIFLYLTNIVWDALGHSSDVGQIFNAFRSLITLFFLGAGLIYAIDTLTLGFFKKYKGLSKFYFPIYKFIGVITFASIYRSIYYSLISRFPKKYIRLALLFYVVLFVVYPFVKFDQYIFYPDNSGSNSKLWRNEYDDLRNGDSYIRVASIPTQIVSGSFLPLFVRYSVRDNEVLSKFCTDFVPTKKDGFNSGIYFKNGSLKVGDAIVNEENPEKALECLSNFYSVKIDSVEIIPDFYLYIHPNQQERGVQTMLEIGDLERGKHEIFINRKKLNKKQEIEDTEYTRIVFWKE